MKRLIVVNDLLIEVDDFFTEIYIYIYMNEECAICLNEVKTNIFFISTHQEQKYYYCSQFTTFKNLGEQFNAESLTFENLTF